MTEKNSQRPEEQPRKMARDQKSNRERWSETRRATEKDGQRPEERQRKMGQRPEERQRKI